MTTEQTQRTDFGSVSDLLSDEEREEALRSRVRDLTEFETRDGAIIIDLDEFRFLLRLLDETRATRDPMERDFMAEGKSGYEAACVSGTRRAWRTNEMDDSQTTIKAKADHVRAARQVRGHTCHWPGCERQVPPAMWGCRTHWYRLPMTLRNRIWRTYRIGQEETQTPSREYVAVAREVQEWINATA